MHRSINPKRQRRRKEPLQFAKTYEKCPVLGKNPLQYKKAPHSCIVKGKTQAFTKDYPPTKHDGV